MAALYMYKVPYKSSTRRNIIRLSTHFVANKHLTIA